MNKGIELNPKEYRPQDLDNQTPGITPPIKTPRQSRFIGFILFTPISCHDLRLSVGSANIWEEKRQLEKQGWHIHTLNKSITDRDGRKVKTGYYQLDESQRQVGFKAVEAYNSKHYKGVK